MRSVGLLLIIATGAVLIYAGLGLPDFGDPQAPACTHVSDYYIKHAYHDDHTPNIVTVMIADYRSYDTLGETVVVFAAGLACFLMLRGERRRREHEGPGEEAKMIRRESSIIVDVATRVMVPILQIFAFYVIFHGHYSPGGGFQGGALLAASVLLQRVVLGRQRSLPSFPVRLGIPFGVLGILIWVVTGLIPVLRGGNYLQDDRLPFGLSPVWSRNTGILMVEIGVAFAVMGVLVSIFDSLAGDRANGEEGR